ncbi:MAG: hypothetical protein ACKVOO_12450 [Burkholderiaceae bacterium]
MVTPKPNTPTLPAQIEIFRAGQHTDDAGVVHNFSQADVQGMATAYNASLREAPLTIGHPADNLPAYGWVKALSVNSLGRLAMDTHQVLPQFAELVAARRYKKRSASFYPPSHPSNPTQGSWYLRHVAFLGAQPPAIAGLADFADTDAAGAVNFSETAEPITEPTADPLNDQEQRMTQDLRDQLAAAQAAQIEAAAVRDAALASAATAQAQVAAFAEAARTERAAGFASFADAHIQTGQLLPKDKAAVVAVLGLLADAQPVSFAEAGATKTVAPAEWLKGLIAGAKAHVSFGESAAGSLPAQAGQAKGQSDAEIDSQAKAYARQHKVSYAEALSAVTTFTS